MKSQASHTMRASTGSLRLVPEIGLVDLADPELAERLAGKVSDQLEVFAARMREGSGVPQGRAPGALKRVARS